MINYNTQLCPYCSEPFNKDSDIVVCPDCGTPHHRHCWQELGHCINEYKHADGFEWTAVAPVIGPDNAQCPECGAIMPKDTLFCENCGKSMVAGENVATPAGNTASKGPTFMGMSREELTAQVEKELTGEIDGVPIKDAAYYIGNNARYYIFKFKRMKQNPKYRPFCWPAFLFSPLYFCYRKMWKVGLLAMAFNAFINIPSFIVSAAQLGLVSQALVTENLLMLSNFSAIPILAVSVWLGFKAVPLFKDKVVSELKFIKEVSPDENTYRQTVLAKSGPSKIATIMIVFVAISYFFMLFA